MGTAEKASHPPGIGIAVMRERARELGGSVDVDLGVERTLVRARLPLREYAR